MRPGTLFGVLLPTLVWGFCLFGFFTLQPNMAVVLILFGKYVGTQRASGFHWANPLLVNRKVSVRARNLNGEKIKVNDLRGNPIEIALVVVWSVSDTAKAVFDVDHFEDYVHVQSEAALRQTDPLASMLDRMGAAAALTEAAAQTRTHAALRQRLHGWFDGFRTFKFIHAVRDAGLPNIPWDEAVQQAEFAVAAHPALARGDVRGAREALFAAEARISQEHPLPQSCSQ